jgi:hypothetical protein
MRVFALIALVCLLAAPAGAQDEPHGYEDWPRPGEVFDEREDDWELEPNGNPPPEVAPRAPSAKAAPQRERWGGIDFDRKSVIRLEAYFLPVVGFSADLDQHEPGNGIEFHADVKTGEGIAARLAVGDVVSVGLLYIASQHRERSQDTQVDHHSLYLDVLLGGAINEGPIELALYIGAGVGGAVFDFKESIDDTGGAALNLRVQTGLRIMEFVELEAGAGYMFWGYPGETIGHGGFLQLGLVLRF